ncbi:MAG: hypothetical protein EAX86_07495 [Candidatus Heimdallarchaeota archaeon]|nr:hypothetical protein [Candidatus Heimdallarchaeota archaeon]
MSVITKRLEKWLKKPSEPTEKEMIMDFIGDLDTILETMEDMADDMHSGYSDQVIKQRSLSTKIASSLPKFLQPVQIKRQNEKIKEILTTKQKMRHLRETLSGIGSSIETMDLKASPPETHLGNRIYEIAYPGEAITSQNVGTLEERLQILENSFLTSMDQMNNQIQQISQNLATLTQRLDEQGVKIDKIDTKITAVDDKLKNVQATLIKISRKLTQNRTLLALLAGSVIALVIVIIVL